MAKLSYYIDLQLGFTCGPLTEQGKTDVRGIWEGVSRKEAKRLRLGRLKR